MEHLSNDHKGWPNLHEKIYKLCGEMRHLIICQKLNFTGKLEKDNGSAMCFITKSSKNLF